MRKAWSTKGTEWVSGRDSHNAKYELVNKAMSNKCLLCKWMNEVWIKGLMWTWLNKAKWVDDRDRIQRSLLKNKNKKR